MRVVELALQRFQPSLRWNYVLIQSYTSIVVTYLNDQGGTMSLTLHSEALEILKCVEQFFLSLRMIHIKGDLDQKADWFRRLRVDNSQLFLNQEVFSLICQMVTLLSTDPFVNHTNTKRLIYFTREADPCVPYHTVAHKTYFACFHAFRYCRKWFRKSDKNRQL